VKSSIQLTRHLSWNGSITKIGNSYYRDTEPREYVDRAPFFTAYSALTLNPWHGWSGSVRFRAISGFKVNGEEGDYIRGPGCSLTDISVTRRINRWLEFNFAVDNIFDRQYYETINRFASALRGQDPLERLHVTPGYPLTVVGGVNIRLFTKDR
jgi:outer membrane receptor protein involved in Fe transport